MAEIIVLIGFCLGLGAGAAALGTALAWSLSPAGKNDFGAVIGGFAGSFLAATSLLLLIAFTVAPL
jgi:hypothetical protein